MKIILNKKRNLPAQSTIAIVTVTTVAIQMIVNTDKITLKVIRTITTKLTNNEISTEMAVPFSIRSNKSYSSVM